MKMEFHIRAPADGVVKSFHCRPGMLINAGDPLVSLA
jgi:urea carboxylase